MSDAVYYGSSKIHKYYKQNTTCLIDLRIFLFIEIQIILCSSGLNQTHGIKLRITAVNQSCGSYYSEEEYNNRTI